MPDPIAVGIDATGLTWLKPLISLGAVLGLTSAILVLLLGQSRILFWISRDGLLPPPWGAKIDQRFHTPYISTLLIGAARGSCPSTVLAGTLPIGLVAELVSIGTLLRLPSSASACWCCATPCRTSSAPFKAPAIYLEGCALGLRADAGTARDHSDAAGDLDGDRAGDLFSLQRAPQPGAAPAP